MLKGYFAERFEGSLDEINSYQMVIINTYDWVKVLKRNKDFILRTRGFWDETEELYGWCITESVRLAYQDIKVLGHQKHDYYQFIYDEFFLGYHLVMRNLLNPHFQGFTFIKCLRVLPMLEKTMIAIGR